MPIIIHTMSMLLRIINLLLWRLIQLVIQDQIILWECSSVHTCKCMHARTHTDTHKCTFVLTYTTGRSSFVAWCLTLTCIPSQCSMFCALLNNLLQLSKLKHILSQQCRYQWGYQTQVTPFMSVLCNYICTISLRQCANASNLVSPCPTNKALPLWGTHLNDNCL